MVIEDLGGDGQFVRPGNVNRWYTSTLTSQNLAPGSFVARPIRFRPGWKPNKLWHPVKRRFVPPYAEPIEGTNVTELVVAAHQATRNIAWSRRCDRVSKHTQTVSLSSSGGSTAEGTVGRRPRSARAIGV